MVMNGIECERAGGVADGHTLMIDINLQSRRPSRDCHTTTRLTVAPTDQTI